MRKADNLPPYCAVVKNSRSLNFLDPPGPAWPVTGVLYLFTVLWKGSGKQVIGDKVKEWHLLLVQKTLTVSVIKLR